MVWSHWRCLVLLAAGGWLTTPGPVAADIDLVWRPAHQDVLVGQPFTIRFYAVADSENDQSISVISAIMVWDAESMALQGNTNNGGYEWLLSLFPNDDGGDCLNCDWSDGDAFYRAWMQIIPPVPAWTTPGGLHVTTMRFNALEETDGVELCMIPAFGAFSLTRVLDGLTPGLDVTGLIDSCATVTILPCGSLADTDADCDVDHDDADTIRECMAGPGTEVLPPCQQADRDGDADVDLQDVAVLQNAFTGP